MSAAGGPPTVLLIAYHYPPCATSSGVQRTLSFSLNLARYGWRPIVLTAHASSYDRASPEQLRVIPPDLHVHRAYALDAAKDLAIGGRYWSRLAIPDRWRGWWLAAVPAALRLVRRHAVDAIWSTYPIATAHSIAATVARLSRVPWIADFRDPMVEHLPETGETFPKDPRLRAARLRIERVAASAAARLVFCTEGARRIVSARYPDLDGQRLAVIPNGYDEDAFRDAERAPPPLPPPGRRVLLHSGTVYPGADRDPTALMHALKALADRGKITPENFELRLRDPSHEEHFRRLAAGIGVERLVSIAPALPYRSALAEMLAADGLLLLQGYPSNPAIPAKLYEYLRARRPIIGLVHPDGETAAALRRLGFDSAALTDAAAIEGLLARWLDDPSPSAAQLPAAEVVASYSRAKLTESLAGLLDAVRGARP